MDELENNLDYIEEFVRFRVEVEMPSDLLNGPESKFGYKYLLPKMILEESPELTIEAALKDQLNVMADAVVREIARRLRA